MRACTSSRVVASASQRDALVVGVARKPRAIVKRGALVPRTRVVPTEALRFAACSGNILSNPSFQRTRYSALRALALTAELSR
jgi:hypothetical protein